jgi:hypothetical protein
VPDLNRQLSGAAVRRSGVRLVLPLLALLALGSACAAQPTSAGSSPSASGSSSSADADSLVIEVDQGDGSPVQRWTLTCGASAGGTHPDAQAACDQLARMSDPFAPIPADRMCTQIYGGPQTAHVTGRWRGDAVDLELSRVDGCRVSQWNDLGPVLPGPVGMKTPS